MSVTAPDVTAPDVTAPNVAGPGAVSPAAIVSRFGRGELTLARCVPELAEVSLEGDDALGIAPDGATWQTGGVGAYTTPG